MKNFKTRMTRLLVVISMLAVVVSAVFIPSSAAEAGSAPIFSGSEYGVTYDNGVYTISIDAERLAEILSSKSFDKETLKSIMPEAVYDLIINRDAESAKVLLQDLLNTASFGQLKDDLPIDLFTDNFSADDLLNVVNIDKLLEVIDVKAIISSVDPSEFENLFLEGKLEELFQSLDFKGILTRDKMEQLIDLLTIDEINAALKDGAIERLVHSGNVDLENLMTKEIIVELFDQTDIITDAEIEDMLQDKTIIQDIIENEDVLDEILHNEVFLQDLAAHPEVIDDLVSDEVIVEIFIKNDLLDPIVASATIPAAKLKEIVFENDIDVADLITPDVIANLDSAVINSIISSDDIKALAECLSDDELREIMENTDCVDMSKIKFSDIYPAYVSADDIKNANVISDADLETLAGMLDASEKQEIGEDIDFSAIGFEDIYNKGYITVNDLKTSGVISPADIDVLTNLLSDTEKEEIVNNNDYADISDVDIADIFPAYISAAEIKNSGVISASDYDTLAAFISDDEKVDIALEYDLIDITSVADYFSTQEIVNSGVISETDRETLANLLSTTEKIDLAIANDYVDTSLLDYSILSSYITLDDIKNNNIISDTELESLDAQVFIDAGLTASDIFDALGTQKAAEIAIEIYKEGRYTNPDGSIGNYYLHLEGIDFGEVVDAIDDNERNAIVEEIKSVPAIRDHIIDMIMEDISILAHAVNIKALYQDGIVTDQMILDVVSNDDITKIIERDIISKSMIIDNIKDLNALIDEVVIERLPIDKILEVFPADFLVDEVMKQNPQGLIDALNVGYLIKMPAVQNELRSITLAEIKMIIDFDAIKTNLMPKILGVFLDNFKVIKINDTPIFVTLDGFDVANMEYAMIDAIPTFDKIAEVGADGEIASFVMTSMIGSKIYNLGFKINLTGDTTKIKEYAAKVVEYFSFVIESDRSVSLKLKAPKQLANAYVSALDSTRVPAAVKTKLMDIVGMEFTKENLDEFADAIIGKLTIEELREILLAVDVKNIDDKLLAQLDLRQSQVELILNYAIKAIDKGLEIVKNDPEINITLSSFYDKSLSDFYVGNGTFDFNFDISIDLMEKVEKFKEIPAELKGYFDNTTITHSVNANVTFDGLYAVEFVRNGQVLYTAYRTEGYEISKITTRNLFKDLAPHGWGGADGLLVETVPAADVRLAEIHLATFKAVDANGTTVKEVVVPYTELSDIDTQLAYPEMPEFEHFTLEWDEFEVFELKDFTVIGRYVPTVYSVTFMADGNVVAVEEYTALNPTVTEPDIPAKDHYTAAWEDYELEYNNDQVINAVYTPIEYSVTFKADGNTVAVETYTIEDPTITEPTVPAKDHYTAAWEDYVLEYTADQVVNAVYTPIEYSVTFIADGNVVAVEYYNIEDPTITEPAVPAKDGFIGAWESYTLNYTDITVNAIYTPDGTVVETYYITFVDEDGNVYGRLEFDRDTDIDTLEAPDTVPVKRGYTVYWPEFKHLIFDQSIFDETGTYSFTVTAVYEMNVYTAKLWNGNTLVASINFTVDTVDTIDLNTYLPRAPRGCIAHWSITTLPLANVDVYLAYAAIEYHLSFIDGEGNVIKVIPFTIFTDSIVPPELPAKKGYTGEWEGWSDFVLVDDDLYDSTGSYSRAIVAKYTPITYYATFLDKDGNEIAKVPFNVEEADITAPAAPVLAGYNVTWPDFKDQILSEETYAATGSYSFTVNANYELIKYSVTFKADGKNVAVLYYTVENKTITEPAVPAKDGYKGQWEKYTLDIGDKVVNAIYTKIDEPVTTYYITFVDIDGNVIEKIPFTVDTDPSTIKAPATIPEKAGYNVYWPSFTLFDSKRYEETGTYSFTVTAVYELIEYTATFMADGKVIAEIPFTVETKSIDEPAIPAKDGYTATWSSYVLGTEDITIDAIYSTISYTVTFIADGVVVGTQTYTVENKNITEPAVPEKEGYTGEWEDYTLDIGDKTVNAVYTEIEEGIPVFWWIMIGILVAAGIALVVVFIILTKKKKKKNA